MKKTLGIALLSLLSANTFAYTLSNYTDSVVSVTVARPWYQSSIHNDIAEQQKDFKNDALDAYSLYDYTIHVEGFVGKDYITTDYTLSWYGDADFEVRVGDDKDFHLVLDGIWF